MDSTSFTLTTKLLSGQDKEKKKERLQGIKLLHQNPNEIENTLQAWFQYLYQTLIENEYKSISVLHHTVQFCEHVIFGTTKTNQRCEELQKEGVLKRSVCGTIWKDGDSAYKCTTCEQDSSCAICMECFSKGNHKGHNYKCIKVAGGMCDCGDFQSWKPSGFCSVHRGISDSIETDSETQHPIFLAARVVFQQLLRYMARLLRTLEYYEKQKTESRTNEMDQDTDDEGELPSVAPEEPKTPSPEKKKGKAQKNKLLRQALKKRRQSTSNQMDEDDTAEGAKSDSKETPTTPESSPGKHLEKLRASLAKLKKPKGSLPTLVKLIQQRQVLVDLCISHLIGIAEWFETICRKGDNFRMLLGKELMAEQPASILRSVNSILVIRRNRSKIKCLLPPDMNNINNNNIENDTRGNQTSFLHLIMEVHVYFDEDMKGCIHNMFFPLLFVPSFRQHFLRQEFIPYYRQHVEDHILSGAHEKDMLADFSVQLFTVGSCSQVMKEDHLLEMLVQKFYNILTQRCLNPETKDVPFPNVEPDSELIGDRLYFRLTADLNFTLAHKDLALYFMFENISTAADRHSTVFSEWFKVLQLVQGMDAKKNVRITEGHAEYDYSKWIHSFLLNIDCMSILQHLTSALPFKEKYKHISIHERYQEVILLCCNSLLEWITADMKLDEKALVAPAFPAPIQDFVVSKSSTSFHYPIHRYLSTMLQEAIKYSEVHSHTHVSLDKLLHSKYANPNFAAMVMEYPLRIQVINAQCRVGMWVRNGREIWGQGEAYHSVFFRDIYRDKDFFLLQLAAVMLGPDAFLKLALTKFELDQWATNTLGTPTKPAEPATEETQSGPVFGEYELKLLEEYLRFVIIVARERTFTGLSDEDTIRLEIIHRLSTKETMTHSELSQGIETRLVEHPQFENILKEVAIFNQPKQMEQGGYQLKDQYWKEFDPYWHHFTSKADIEKAEERYQHYISKLNKTQQREFFLPSERSTYPVFTSLKLLLQSQFLHKILFAVLYCATQQGTPIPETLINATLHLLILALTVFRQSDPDSNIANATSNNSNNNASTPRKRKSMAYTGNMFELEFPSSVSITKNSTYEIPVGWDSPSNESIISLLIKLLKTETFKSQADRINQILALFAENDEDCKQYIRHVATKEKVKTSSVNTSMDVADNDEDLEEQEKKRRRKERQAAIMAKFSQQMQSFTEQSNMFKDIEDEDEELDNTASNTSTVTETPDDAKNKLQDLIKQHRQKMLETNPFGNIETCALCHEQTAVNSRPLGFVTLAQHTRLVQLAKDLKMRRHEIQSLEEEANKQSDFDTSMMIMDDSESEEEEDIDEDEQIMNDKDYDKYDAAYEYLSSLTQDPELEAWRDHEMEFHDMDDISHDDLIIDDDDSDNDDESINSEEHAHTEDQPNTQEEQPADEDLGEHDEPSIEDNWNDQEDDISENEHLMDVDVNDMDNDPASSQLLFAEFDDDDEDPDDEDDIDFPMPTSVDNQMEEANEATAEGENAAPTNQSSMWNSDTDSSMGSFDLDNADHHMDADGMEGAEQTFMDRLARLIRGFDSEDLLDIKEEYRNIKNGLSVFLDIQNLIDMKQESLEGVEAAMKQIDALLSEMTFAIEEQRQAENDIKEQADMEVHNKVMAKLNRMKDRLSRLKAQAEKILRAVETAVVLFDLEKGSQLSISYCNNHVIHNDCLKRYMDSLMERERAGNEYEGEGIIDLRRDEFLCVVCRRFANCLVPIIPFNVITQSKSQLYQSLSLSQSLSQSQLNVLPELEEPPQPNITFGEWLHNNLEVTLAGEVVIPADHQSTFSPQLMAALDSFVLHLKHIRKPPKMPRRDAIVALDPAEDLSSAKLLWASVGATVASLEVALRNKFTAFGTQRSAIDLMDQSSTMRLTSLCYCAFAFRYARLASPKLHQHHEVMLNILMARSNTKSIDTNNTDNTNISNNNNTQAPVTPMKSQKKDSKSKQNKEDNMKTPNEGNEDIESKEDKQDRQDKLEALTNMELPLLSNEAFSSLVQLVFLWPNAHTLSTDLPFMIRLFYEVNLYHAFLQAYLLVLEHEEDERAEKEAAETASGTTTPTPESKQKTPSKAKSPFEPKIPQQKEPVQFTPETILIRDILDQLRPSETKLPRPNADTLLKRLKDLPETCYSVAKSLLIPFLRRSVLLQSACLQTPLPSPSETNESHSWDSEFDFLRQYLKLPTIQEISAQLIRDVCSGNETLPIKWIRQFLSFHTDVEFLFDLLPAQDFPDPIKLIELPEMFHDLLQKYANTKCATCHRVPITKALCLICGRLCCAGNSCCRTMDEEMLGECSLHSRLCSGVGIFLILKSSLVLVIRGAKYSFWGSPYLDEHGEEDPYISRGRPLYLNKDRYEQLTQLFVNQQVEWDSGIVESTSTEDANWY